MPSHHIRNALIISSGLLIASFIFLSISTRYPGNARAGGQVDHLAFTYLPSNEDDPGHYYPTITAGEPFSVEVTAFDAQGSVVSDFSDTIDLQSYSSSAECRGGALLGTLSQQAVTGVAKFSDLSYTKACFQAFSIIATSPSVPPAGAAQSLPYFNVKPGVGTHLGFLILPSGVTAQQQFSVGVGVFDQFENPTSDTLYNGVSIQLDLIKSPDNAATLEGRTVQLFERNGAFFNDLLITAPGTFSLRASLSKPTGFGDLAPGQSESFVAHGVPAKLIFTNGPFGPFPTNTSFNVNVALVDAAGNIIADDETSEVTMSLTTPADGTIWSGAPGTTLHQGQGVFGSVTFYTPGTYRFKIRTGTFETKSDQFVITGPGQTTSGKKMIAPAQSLKVR